MKYVGDCHAQHLLDVLKKHYAGVTKDCSGNKFAGIDLECTYSLNMSKCKVRLTMNGYIKATLIKYGHKNPTKPQP